MSRKFGPAFLIGAGAVLLSACIALYPWARGPYSPLALGLLLRLSVGSIIVGPLRLAGVKNRRTPERRGLIIALFVALLVVLALPFWWVFVPAIIVGILFAVYIGVRRDGSSA